MENSKLLIAAAAVLALMPLAYGVANAQTSHDHSAHEAPHSSPLISPIPASDDVNFVFSAAPEDHAIGDIFAPHTLIVYASVVCGHCGKWFTDDYPVIKKELVDTGKLRLIFREFPTQPADVAFAGFQLANCAAPDDYFDAIVYQFQNQEETFDRLRIGEGRARFLELAKKAGIQTEDEMLACFENEAGKARVETAMSRAEAGGVNAVPALILDGKLMPGLNGASHVLAALGESPKE